MATAWITEFDETGNSAALSIVSLDALVTSQTVTYTTAAQSAAFNSETVYIEIYLDAAAHIAYGANPTATATSPKYPGTTLIQRRVTAGNKISVYDGSS